jgi:hypothetical protein
MQAINNDEHVSEINELIGDALASEKLDTEGAATLKTRLSRNELSVSFARGYLGALHTGANVDADAIGGIQ